MATLAKSFLTWVKGFELEKFQPIAERPRHVRGRLAGLLWNIRKVHRERDSLRAENTKLKARLDAIPEMGRIISEHQAALAEMPDLFEAKRINASNRKLKTTNKPVVIKYDDKLDEFTVSANVDGIVRQVNAKKLELALEAALKKEEQEIETDVRDSDPEG